MSVSEVLREAEVKDMMAFDAPFSQKAGKSNRKLVVNQKFHEACRMG